MNINGVPTNPGDLRVPITLQKQTVSTETGGFQVPTYATLATVMSKWVNVHGSEIWAAQIVESIAPAKVLIRYRSDLDATCIALLGSRIYEITSIDDIQARHEYLELTVVYVRSG